jgi:hypothetical protein
MNVQNEHGACEAFLNVYGTDEERCAKPIPSEAVDYLFVGQVRE